MGSVDLDERIPNNVNLCATNKRLQRALEKAWQPNYLKWWMETPGRRTTRPTTSTCARRSTVGREGLGPLRPRQDARLPLGHLPEPLRRCRTARSRCGDHFGAAGLAAGARRVPQRAAPHHRDPGRHRAGPASSSSACWATPRPACTTCATCSRSTSRRAATCGRWSTCCTRYFGRDGREEAEELLERRSGNPDHPRILGTFNEPCRGLAVLLHVHDVHRPGRQVPAAGPGRERLRPARRARRASCSPRRRTTCSWARPGVDGG